MNINYKLIGEGKETVLFLHGWGANLNSFLFCENALINNYKLLMVDFPGFGESEKLTTSFNVFDYTLQIYKLLNKLNIKKVSLVCHSFGGRVAILLCTIFNIEVNKLVIIDAAGIKPRFNIITKLKVLNYKFKKFLNKIKLTKFNLSGYGSEDYKILNEIEKQTFKNVVNFNEVNYLNKINVKTLILWGDSDTSTPVYMAKKFNKKIKNSKLIILKKAGHFCFLEYPNLVTNEIVNFLMFN